MKYEEVSTVCVRGAIVLGEQLCLKEQSEESLRFSAGGNNN